MRFANIAGRAQIQVEADRYVDIEHASGGRLPSDPMECLRRWDEVRAWADLAHWADDAVRAEAADALDAPVPLPSQLFAVGLNYALHAVETGMDAPQTTPLIFTKFASSITGPRGELELPGDTVDWEVELVVVIGKGGHRITADDAWDHIAGLTLGQDYSERTLQMAGTPPQFSLAKSYPGFAPLGPVLVTSDEFADRENISLDCVVSGTVVQSGSTAQLIHTIPALVEFLSSVTALSPGDLIFTGTPDGVGMGRSPQLYLKDGDVVVTSSPEIGTLEQRCRQVGKVL